MRALGIKVLLPTGSAGVLSVSVQPWEGGSLGSHLAVAGMCGGGTTAFFRGLCLKVFCLASLPLTLSSGFS